MKQLIECNDIENIYNGTYDKLQKIQIEIRERQNLKELNQKKVNDYNIKINEILNKVSSINQKIKDLYDVAIPKDINNYNHIDLNLQREEIKKIKKKIDLIGPINLAIDDEFIKEKERYAFLEDQYNDLRNSEEIINKTIKKLDKEAKVKFLKTFKLIEDNFSKTYSSFFNGN